MWTTVNSEATWTVICLSGLTCLLGAKAAKPATAGATAPMSTHERLRGTSEQLRVLP